MKNMRTQGRKVKLTPQDLKTRTRLHLLHERHMLHEFNKGRNNPNTLKQPKTLSTLRSLNQVKFDKGRRYKRRKETKGKKVVSSLDFQEDNTGAEKINTAVVKASKQKTPKRLKEDKDDEAKDDEPTKKLTKRRKQIARKGMHTSVDENVSDDSDKVAQGLTSPEQTATGKGISNPFMAVMVCQKPYGIQLTNVSITNELEMDFCKETSKSILKFSNDSPLTGVNTPGSDENRPETCMISSRQSSKAQSEAKVQRNLKFMNEDQVRGGLLGKYCKQT
ncbi:hypothetical protein Tco_0718056 [Tanacetum coccineum]